MKKPETLSANISNLLNSLPEGFDEDENDDTCAKVVSADSEESDQEEIEKSKIRIQNIDFLDATDDKYAGKVSSRKDCQDIDSEFDSQDEIEVEHSDHDSGASFYNGSDEEDISEEDVDERSDSDESEFEEHKDISGNNKINGEVSFQNFINTNSNDEGNKGQSVRIQLKLWETMLEMRIKSKKGLSASNKMPVGEKYEEIFKQADVELKGKFSQTKKNLFNLLEKMITLHNLLLNKYPETKKLLSEKNNGKIQDINDEEISSEDDCENEPEIKRIKIKDYEKSLAEQHEVFKTYRNKTIEKWYEKTRIKHTEMNSHSIVDQINHILMDKSKSIKKTQMKRSNYRIIGETDEDQEHNVNIFDDEDFYHQQLRELVEFKSSDITDPLQLSRQWVQLQNMRSKMKRKIDTRATKGRKLRFGVHSKIVNHFAPHDYTCSKSEDARKELFRSIFQNKK